MNLVGVAAQYAGFGPGAGIPEADGVVAPRGDQPSSILRELEPANVRRVSVEPDDEPAGRGVPDTDVGIVKTRARSQHLAVRRDGQRGQPEVPFVSALPEFLTCGKIKALDVVTVVRSVRTRDIETPVVRGKPG